MKYLHITFIISIIAFLSACSTENDLSSDNRFPVFPSDKDWTEELMDGASATVKGFEPGDAASRTSLVYDGQGLVFGWKEGDRLGLYPTAKDLTSLINTNAPKLGMLKAVTTTETSNGSGQEGESSQDGESSLDSEIMEGLLSKDDNPHPSLSSEPNLYRVDPKKSKESPFTCVPSSSQTTRIENGSADFVWDDVVRWSAYYPYKQQNEENDENYVKRYFSFANQIQKALPNVGDYFEADETNDEGEKAELMNKYHLSESQACEHLGNCDVMISPETKWTDGIRINFQMRHVGAIARIYLRAVEENLTIKDVKLICDKKIFYEQGSFTLFSHPYKNEEANNFGVDLDRNSENCQIKSVGDPVNMLKLTYADNCVTKKSTNNIYGPYVVAYLMMYPITYNPTTDGNLFAYVTAADSEGNEVHYVSEPLSKKTMKSGKYYQWTSATHPDDGLYPIEMTATLLPWQEIVGADIDLDLEK